MVSAVQTYIQEEMGQQYIEPPTFDLSLSYQDSNFASPLIFVLSPGADPMAGLFRFAEEKGNSFYADMNCFSKGFQVINWIISNRYVQWWLWQGKLECAVD